MPTRLPWIGLTLGAAAALCLLLGCADLRQAARYQAGKSTRDMAADTIMERIDRYQTRGLR